MSKQNKDLRICDVCEKETYNPFNVVLTQFGQQRHLECDRMVRESKYFARWRLRTCAICEKLTWDIVGTLQKRTVAVECHKAHWYYYEAQTLTDWRKLMLTAATCEDFEEAKDAQSTGD